MLKGDLSRNIPVAFATGSALATVWYFATSSIATGSYAVAIPTFGAIAVAGLTQAVIFRRAISRITSRRTLSMAQRLEAFNSHAIVNVVDRNHCITEVNERLLEVTGFSREELIGKPVTTIYDTDAQYVAADIYAHLEAGETWHGETPLKRAKGGITYAQATVVPLFDSRGEFSGSIAVRTDVSRARQLAAEHQTAQTLFELRDDIWIVDAENEAFMYMNRSASDRLDWKAREVVDKSLDDLPDDEGVAQILTACRNLKKSAEASTHLETEFVGVMAHVSIKLIADTDTPPRYLVLISDVSDRVERDRQMTEFISMVSHELRSPMTSIKGAMGLALSGSAGEIPEKAKSLLEIAHRNADRLVLIINDILDLEKIAQGQMEFDMKEVDLIDLVKEADKASRMLQQRFGVDVVIDDAGAPALIHTDANRVVQVMMNLLSNAYKFSRPGGTITIRVAQTDGLVRVSVQDEGQGIAVKDQHKVFEKFADMSNSDRAAKGGTGLGLNICKIIVEGLGGTIGFTTKEGVGTTFYFSLPGTAEGADEPRPQSASY